MLEEDATLAASLGTQERAASLRPKLTGCRGASRDTSAFIRGEPARMREILALSEGF